MAALEKAGLSGTMEARGPDARLQHCRRAMAELMICVAAAGAASSHLELEDEGDTVLARCRSSAGGQSAAARLEKCRRCGGIDGARGPIEFRDEMGLVSQQEADDVASHDPECPAFHVREVLKS